MTKRTIQSGLDSSIRQAQATPPQPGSVPPQSMGYPISAPSMMTHGWSTLIDSLLGRTLRQRVHDSVTVSNKTPIKNECRTISDTKARETMCRQVQVCGVFNLK